MGHSSSFWIDGRTAQIVCLFVAGAAVLLGLWPPSLPSAWAMTGGGRDPFLHRLVCTGAPLAPRFSRLLNDHEIVDHVVARTWQILEVNSGGKKFDEQEAVESMHCNTPSCTVALDMFRHLDAIIAADPAELAVLRGQHGEYIDVLLVIVAARHRDSRDRDQILKRSRARLADWTARPPELDILLQFSADLEGEPRDRIQAIEYWLQSASSSHSSWSFARLDSLACTAPDAFATVLMKAIRRSAEHPVTKFASVLDPNGRAFRHDLGTANLLARAWWKASDMPFLESKYAKSIASEIQVLSRPEMLESKPLFSHLRSVAVPIDSPIRTLLAGSMAYGVMETSRMRLLHPHHLRK